MKLLVDVGNTRIKWACWEADELSATMALDLRTPDVAERWSAVLATLAPQSPVLLASVLAGAAGAMLAARLAERFDTVIRIGPPRSLPGLQLAYAQPETLGVDRWLGMLAAVADAPCLVVSCGSALTLDLIDDHGRHRGGLIAPSPERMREALLQRAPHLAGHAGRVVEFADSTIDAVESGAVLAAVALIERQADIARGQLGKPVRLLITGGGSDALLPSLRGDCERREQLVFEGMRRWWALTDGQGADAVGRAQGAKPSPDG